MLDYRIPDFDLGIRILGSTDDVSGIADLLVGAGWVASSVPVGRWVSLEVRSAEVPEAVDLAVLVDEESVICERSDGSLSIYFRDGWVDLGSASAVRVFRVTGCADRPPLVSVSVAIAQAVAVVGVTMVHALAAELHGLRILALGPSGAGKSTLAAAVLAAGGCVVSDDLVWLGLDATGQVRIRGSRPFLSFRAGTLPVLPASIRAALRACVADDGERYWDLYRQDCPAAFMDSFVPDCLLVVRRSSTAAAGSALATLSHAEAYAAFQCAAQPLHFVDTRGPALVEAATGVARAVVSGLPLYRLDAGVRLVTDPVSEMRGLADQIHRQRGLGARASM